MPDIDVAEEVRTFDADVLAAVPQLAAVRMQTSDKTWFSETVPGTMLMAFYRDGRLLNVWNGATGAEYCPHTDAERRLYAMSASELTHYFADRDDYGATSKVYFIGCDGHPIKIGVTVDLKARFQAIQMCSPLKLEVYATRPGGESREKAYHCQFAAHRLHGEWFEPHPDILAEIERLQPLSAIRGE